MLEEIIVMYTIQQRGYHPGIDNLRVLSHWWNSYCHAHCPAHARVRERHFLPFNPTDKKTALTYFDSNGKMHRVSKGAPEQEVPEGVKESPGGLWQFIGLMPLLDPPGHYSAETIRRGLNLRVHVKMIIGDQLAIGKETGRRLGMGTNMYLSASLLGQSKDESIASLAIDDLIEKSDGFADVFPGNS